MDGDLSQVTQLISCFARAITLQHGGLLAFTLEFLGFAPCWGYVCYEKNNGVGQEISFNNLAELQAILDNIQLPKKGE